MENKIKVGISCGDPNGVGMEVVLKALSDNRILDSIIPVLYAHPEWVKQTKKVFISELNKSDMLELIGYNIAKTFSKYINILSNIIDEVLKIKSTNLKNKKIKKTNCR